MHNRKINKETMGFERQLKTKWTTGRWPRKGKQPGEVEHEQIRQVEVGQESDLGQEEQAEDDLIYPMRKGSRRKASRRKVRKKRCIRR